MTARDFSLLRGKVGIVQLFDFLGDRQHGLAARQHLAPQKPGALTDFFRERPVEQWIERLPILIEPLLQADNALVAFVARSSQIPQIGDRGQVHPPEFFELLAIFGSVLASGVEQVVAHEDAGQMHVGAQAPQLRFDLAMVSVDLIDLRVDLLRSSRRREHGDHHQQDQTSEREGG